MFRVFNVFLLCLCVSSVFAENTVNSNAFDSLCLIFEKASSSYLKPVELGKKIAEELEKLEDQFALKDVKSSYYALFSVEPTKRYALFKEEAEFQLKRSWSCEKMKIIYSTTQ